MVTYPLGDGKPTEEKLPGEDGVCVAAIAPDGKSVLLAGLPKGVPLLHGQTGGVLKRVGVEGKVLGGPIAYSGDAVAVAFASDGKGVFFAVNDHPAGRYDLFNWDGTDAKLGRRTGFAGPLQVVEALRDGRVLTGSQESIRLLNPETGSMEAPARLGEFGGVAAFPDGRLAIGDVFAGVRVWKRTDLATPIEMLAGVHNMAAISDERIALPGIRGNRVVLRTDAHGGAETHIPDPKIDGFGASVWIGDQLALMVPPFGRQAVVTAAVRSERRFVARRWELPPDSFPAALAPDAERGRPAFVLPQTTEGELKPRLVVHVYATTTQVRHTLPMTSDVDVVQQLAFSPTGRIWRRCGFRTSPRRTFGCNLSCPAWSRFGISGTEPSRGKRRLHRAPRRSRSRPMGS